MPSISLPKKCNWKNTEEDRGRDGIMKQWKLPCD